MNSITRLLLIVPLALMLAACGGAQPEAAPPANPTSEAVGAPVEEAANVPFPESGLLTVPFEAGAREYRWSVMLPESWRGRYTLTPKSESATTFSYLPMPDQRIPLFTILALPEAEWASAPAPGATALTTFEGIVFAYIPGDVGVLADEGPDAAAMLADLPAILESIEITRNEDPSG